MATNNFKPFAIGSGANVTSQSDYEQLVALLTGFQAGKASSAQINKALRQSSVMAHVLAQFISDSAGVDVLDNGNPANILANLKTGMTKVTPGRLIGIQYLTTTGTYIKTPGTKNALVKGVGGGGAGGGVGATSSGSVRAGGGGAAGTYGEMWIANIPDAVPYTIGSAGNGVAGGDGGNGGASTFGSYLSLPGGGGGQLGLTVSGAARTAGGGAASSPATGASYSVQGQRGADAYSVSNVAVIAGSGASNPLGSGAPTICATSTTNTPFSSVGVAASGSGAGGGGALSGVGGGAQPGGAATGGVFIVEEYA